MTFGGICRTSAERLWYFTVPLKLLVLIPVSAHLKHNTGFCSVWSFNSYAKLINRTRNRCGVASVGGGKGQTAFWVGNVLSCGLMHLGLPKGPSPTARSIPPAECISSGTKFKNIFSSFSIIGYKTFPLSSPRRLRKPTPFCLCVFCGPTVDWREFHRAQ